ncbi:replication factor A protein 1-like [Pyrus ussuriensis x Pyrus communis]|uniref:ATP-dependent DNA helicase n=1 Tax=Pyrus ussuriensis x Pyrus communis TaxID=2448454 RepID=A0A5N5FFT5_9ROSA|nr:replication factor A protein 1-like [Pyrus ussuriensis x Pyrus communis]
MCDDISIKMINAFGLQDMSKCEDELKNSLLYDSLSKHHLPIPSKDVIDRLKNRSLREELNYDTESLKEQHSQLVAQLNKEQKIVYDSVIKVVDHNKPGMFFVHGHGGTGKTFLWTAIIAKIRSENHIVFAVASSGIASFLLPGGRPAHSRFKIPISITDCSLCEIKKGTHLAQLISDAALIVWDEAPMNHKQCFETLDRSLHDVLKGSKPGFDDLPFGGKPILFGGDFRQILPVVPNGTKADIVEASLTSSYLWPYLTIFFLTENMRLSKIGLNEKEKQELANFANWILQIGNGSVANSILTSNKIVPHDAMLELNKNTSIVPVEKPNQVIPMHWFNLIEFDKLDKRVDKDVHLTDVFGCLMALQPIEDITMQNIRVEKKQDLQLQNTRGEQVTVTLWAETATSFQEDALKSLSPPVFIVLTSLKVKKYKGKPVLGTTGSTVCIFNPDIPLLSEYKQKFEYLKTPIEILLTSAEKYGKKLLLLDPTLNKNTSFMCQATIVDYDLTNGWWYKSCPYCHKSVKNTYGTFQCFEHGLLKKCLNHGNFLISSFYVVYISLQSISFKMNFIVDDATNQFNFLVIGRTAEKLLGISCHSLVIEEGYDDSSVLPPHLQKLVGSTKKFMLHFGNQNNEFGNTDFVVHGIIEEQTSVEPKLSSIVPRTLARNIGKQVIDATTPLPFTTLESQTQRIQSVATNKGVKRTLFVENEPSKAHSKHDEGSQPLSTNSTRISAEFSNLVVPKVEPADKSPINALRSRSQTKKIKDSVGDVHSPKK